jgi:hypothetical protein
LTIARRQPEPGLSGRLLRRPYGGASGPRRRENKSSRADFGQQTLGSGRRREPPGSSRHRHADERIRRKHTCGTPAAAAYPTPLMTDACLPLEATVRCGWRESSKRSSASVGAGAPFRGEPVVRSPTEAIARRPTATSGGSTAHHPGDAIVRPPAARRVSAWPNIRLVANSIVSSAPPPLAKADVATTLGGDLLLALGENKAASLMVVDGGGCPQLAAVARSGPADWPGRRSVGGHRSHGAGHQSHRNRDDRPTVLRNRVSLRAASLGA